MGTVIICAPLAPGSVAPWSLASDTVFDTDKSSMCAAPQAGRDSCVVITSVVNIKATLRATGSRPLVIVALTSVTISGTIDASSHLPADASDPELGAGADPQALCTASGAGAQGLSPPGPGGGGAGGASATSGGAGGASNGAGGLPGQALGFVDPERHRFVDLHGGCAGSDGQGTAGGPGGHGGGAVAILSPRITVTGTITVAGEGGAGGASACGGGGGGGGGELVLETIDPGSVDAGAATAKLGGTLIAGGGGGGEGAGGSEAGYRGAEASVPMYGGTGGSGASNTGGNGGDGGAAATIRDGQFVGSPAGAPGGSTLNAKSGGGGGGGAAGGVVLQGPFTLDPAHFSTSPWPPTGPD